MEGQPASGILKCTWRSGAFALGQLDRVVGEFRACVDWGDVIAVQAPMGMGKTTFIAALARVMGAPDAASSPTFALCQEYPIPAADGGQDRLVRHLDLYRIEHVAELRDLGWEEMMYDEDALILVEWPERAADHFPERAKLLRMEAQPDGLRLASLWLRESV